MDTLIQIVDAAVADAVRRSDSHLACRIGCTQCCTGVFAISQQDAARLRDALASLAQNDPDRAQRIRTRVAASITRIEPDFPGDPTTGILAEDDASRAFFDDEFAEDEVCPVLDPATGACDLYAARPILCRTFGPAMRDEDGNFAAWELCYTTATEEEIAACEIDPRIAIEEEASNSAFNATHNAKGETIIAFALR